MLLCCFACALCAVIHAMLSRCCSATLDAVNNISDAVHICTATADLHKSTARQSFVETNFQKDQEPKETAWAIVSNLLLCIISGAFDLLSSKVVHLYFGFFANDIAIYDQCIFTAYFSVGRLAQI